MNAQQTIHADVKAHAGTTFNAGRAANAGPAVITPEYEVREVTEAGSLFRSFRVFRDGRSVSSPYRSQEAVNRACALLNRSMAAVNSEKTLRGLAADLGRRMVG